MVAFDKITGKCPIRINNSLCINNNKKQKLNLHGTAALPCTWLGDESAAFSLGALDVHVHHVVVSLNAHPHHASSSTPSISMPQQELTGNIYSQLGLVTDALTAPSGHGAHLHSSRGNPTPYSHSRSCAIHRGSCRATAPTKNYFSVSRRVGEHDRYYQRVVEQQSDLSARRVGRSLSASRVGRSLSARRVGRSLSARRVGRSPQCAASVPPHQVSCRHLPLSVA